MEWLDSIELEGVSYTGNELVDLAGKMTPHHYGDDPRCGVHHYTFGGHLLVFKGHRGYIVSPNGATHVEIDYGRVVKVVPGDESILLDGKDYTGADLRDAVRIGGKPVYKDNDAFWDFKGYDVRFRTSKGAFVSPFDADYIEIIKPSGEIKSVKLKGA